MEEISAVMQYKKFSIEVLGAQMAYVDTGNSEGPVVVFLHGNPTSSYLWRNIIPHVAPHGRCIAPDLMGMGDSAKLPGSAYRFADHAHFLDAFLAALFPDQPVFLVLHDWGSALGLDWARQHEERVAGLVLMEFIAPFPSWKDFPEQGRDLFRAFRDPAVGRKLLIEQNVFIEQVLQAGVVRQLSEDEMHHYRLPFTDPRDREPLFRFPNEIPIEGLPSDVYARAESYHAWLLQNKLPKLYFWGSPGGLIPEAKAAWYIDHLHNTVPVAIGAGNHFIQEDHPHLIGKEIASWLICDRSASR